MPNKPAAYLYIIAGLAIIAFGLHLRIQNSSSRIFHSDEAVQAYQLWELMESGSYQYDPIDKHGPLLYYLSAGMNRIAGIDSSELTQQAVRLLPMVASALLLGLIVFGRRRIDAASLFAGALFALSPLPVIYGAYYVQEAMFALNSFAALYAFNAYWSKPTPRKAAIFAFALGLLFATKETAIIHAFAIGVAVVWGQAKGERFSGWKDRAQPRALTVALSVFIAVWVFCFTGGFRDFSQLDDSVKAFFHYADRSQGQGHEKPFFYYLSLFWPNKIQGVSWGEAPFLIATVIGYGLLLWKRRENEPQVRLAALYGLVCFVVYSAIPYKTPWLMLTSCVSFAYAAAFALHSLYSFSPRAWLKGTVVVAFAYLCWDQYHSTRFANRYAADSRNPYIYQHTSSQFKKLVERIEDLDALDPNTPVSIAVGGEDNAWPLPWFMRESQTIGYWSDPTQVPNLDIVIGPAGALPSVLGNTHIAEYHGLRENVMLECWIRKELWDAFMATR